MPYVSAITLKRGGGTKGSFRGIFEKKLLTLFFTIYTETDMERTNEMIEQLKADLSGATTYRDLMGKDGAIKNLLAKSIEQMLDSELTEHLGYPRHSPAGNNSGNNRNGKTRKRLKNDNGEIEDEIISMYAKGMTTRDIQSHVTELYGIDISPTLVSNITNKLIDLAEGWHSGPLEKVYPIIFLDAIH